MYLLAEHLHQRYWDHAQLTWSDNEAYILYIFDTLEKKFKKTRSGPTAKRLNSQIKEEMKDFFPLWSSDKARTKVANSTPHVY